MKDLLVEHFDVRHIFVDPDAPIDRASILDDSEYVLVWQLDFLTPIFISAGKKVVVAQMFDGSGSLPDSHWALNRQARYLNFSLFMHNRALQNGCESKLVKFFPNPAGVEQVTDFSSRRVFLWQRHPQSFISAPNVSRALHGQIDRFHLHAVADDGSTFDSSTLGALEDRTIVTEWFPNRNGYYDALAQSNIFIAPRIAEGIGHAFLEAMARGMLVIAYDLPTHNEYISNWFNGILFSEAAAEIHIDSARWSNLSRELGANAADTVRLGHQKWIADQRSIVDFILGTEKAETLRHPQLDDDIDRIISAYQSGIGNYSAALDKFELTRAILSQWKAYNHDETVAHERLFRPGDDAVNVIFGSGNDAAFVLDGWSWPENGQRWAIAEEARICIPAAAIAGMEASLKEIVLDIRSASEKEVVVSVGDAIIGACSVTERYQRFRLPLRAGAFSESSDIVFHTKALENLETDRRPLAFAIKSLRIGDFGMLPERTAPQRTSVA
jgi:hypothetical protein